MDELDRTILNRLQGGFPVSERPFAAAAAELGTTEEELISRLGRMLQERRLSRFGPLYNAERMGGAFTLAALSVPPAHFERIAALVNAMPEVAHNYERAHRLNMWFVLATDTPEGIERALHRIEAETGCRVYNFPKLREYFVELKLAV
jgi:DNA-binding Lrp family transcriptional regulator